MPEKLKDILFPRDKVKYFADTLKKVHPPFDATGFVNVVCDDDWPEREIKEKMRVEYLTHYVKSSGKSSPKVFQIKEVVLAPGIHKVEKKHTFANMSTRKHYPGEHRFDVVINGEKKASIPVDLKPM